MNAESNKAAYAKLVPKYESQMASNQDNLTRSIENAKQKSVETDDDGLLWIIFRLSNLTYNNHVK